ncbi:zf-DHHC-domain-containing protein [Ramaria rubella]|nr:zf-DHHC-domain-containing protein [Ramaria rubella]
MVSSRTTRLFGRIWVTCTTLLIAFIAYSVQIFVIYPWYGSEISIDLLKLLGPFNALIGLLYWNYFMTVVTDPGRVPNAWKPEGDDYEVKKLTGGPRFCRTCDSFKPPRAHHCRQCGRCVLRMDHHCPWVNNCVGHFNYAHFIRFLVYVDISCTYHLWMLTARALSAYDTARGYWIEPSSTELVFIILNYVFCVPVILAVGAFSGYHIYCLLTNTTTIEGWEKDKVATLIRRGKIREIKFPYNLGIKENAYSVLGPSPLYWPFPIKETSTGLKFRIANGEGKWIEFRHNEYEMEDVAPRARRHVRDLESGKNLGL